MKYQWDLKKSKSNEKKHGIDFADTIGVFEDEWALTIEERFIEGEQRFITIRTDFLGRILFAVYTYRIDEIRLISARATTKVERKVYEQRRV